jgi:colanic acid biosynthesis glycosyl transferase WcaI
VKILIVTQYYWPEAFSAGVYMPELAEGLSASGHEVEVITGFPNYPQGVILKDYQGRLFQVEERNGVRIRRGWFFCTSRSSGIQRGVSAVSFMFSALFAGWGARRPDLVLGFSPPPFMGLAAWWLARHWRVPYVLNVKDFFSESIIASGLIRPGIVANLLLKVERFLYYHTDHLIVPAEGFVEKMAGMGLSRTSISVVPDWADGDLIRPMDKENIVRQEWGLKGKFILLYSGSLGYLSCLEPLLEAFAQVKDLPSLYLVIVGEGVKRPQLEHLARSLQLDHVQFYDLQSRKRFPEVLAAADVTIATLAPQAGRVSTQGKLYSMMAAGRPVLGILPSDADASTVIKEGRIGWQRSPEDVPGIAQLLRHLVQNEVPMAEYGRNARRIFEAKYSLESCLRQMNAIFEQILGIMEGR